MQVIGGKNNPVPLLEPGVDFLQERGIDQAAGERVIDTQYDFVPGVATRLNGRKYIGENTVREMGRLIGLVDADEANRVRAEFEAYKAQIGLAFETLRGVTATVDHVIQNQPSSTTEVAPVPDQDAIIAEAQARHQAEVDQINAAQAAAEAASTSDSQEEDVATKHLTGAERAAVERQVGPLREVGDRGDLVDVPEEHEKVVEGVEEISGLETAKAVYNRGVGAGEAKADEIRAEAEKTDAAQDSNQAETAGTTNADGEDSENETGGR